MMCVKQKKTVLKKEQPFGGKIKVLSLNWHTELTVGFRIESSLPVKRMHPKVSKYHLHDSSARLIKPYYIVVRDIYIILIKFYLEIHKI